MYLKVVTKNGSEQTYDCERFGFHKGVKTEEGKQNMLEISTGVHGEINLFLQPGDAFYVMNADGKTIDSRLMDDQGA